MPFLTMPRPGKYTPGLFMFCFDSLPKEEDVKIWYEKNSMIRELRWFAKESITDKKGFAIRGYLQLEPFFSHLSQFQLLIRLKKDLAPTYLYREHVKDIDIKHQKGWNYYELLRDQEEEESLEKEEEEEESESSEEEKTSFQKVELTPPKTPTHKKPDIKEPQKKKKKLMWDSSPEK